MSGRRIQVSSAKKQLGATYGGFSSWQSIFAVTLGTIAMLGSVVKAGSLDLGEAGRYAVVALGSGDTIGQNSGPAVGKELLGHGVTAAFAGGNNGAITGGLFYDSTTGGQNTFDNLQNAPVTTLVSPTVTQSAFDSALAVSQYAESLGSSPTQAFSTSIVGNGGLNVINVTDINNVAFNISGGASDTFVFNVSGQFKTNRAMTLSGISGSQILFNFLGTSGHVFETSGGNVLFGTYLATRGDAQFQFSNLALTGALINTVGDVQLVSGSQVTYTPLTPVPLPAAFWAGSALMTSLGGVKLIRRRGSEL
jgi:hypothetical protein